MVCRIQLYIDHTIRHPFLKPQGTYERKRIANTNITAIPSAKESVDVKTLPF